MEIFLGFVVLTGLVAWWAGEWGRSVGWAIAGSILLTPVVWAIILLILGRKTSSPGKGAEPLITSMPPAGGPSRPVQRSAAVIDQSRGVAECPNCMKAFTPPASAWDESRAVCPRCKTKFSPDAAPPAPVVPKAAAVPAIHEDERRVVDGGLESFVSRAAPKQNPETTIWQPSRLWRPEGQWKILVERAAVAGMGHYRLAVADALSAFKKADRRGGKFALLLTPEPTNEFDSNAIAVYGVADGIRPKHIGYVSGDRAEQLADLLPPGTPLAADLVGTFEAGEKGRETISMRILIPRQVYAELPTDVKREFAQGW